MALPCKEGPLGHSAYPSLRARYAIKPRRREPSEIAPFSWQEAADAITVQNLDLRMRVAVMRARFSVL